MDAATGSIAGTTAGILVSPSAANRLVFGVQPTDTTAGAAINPAVTVVVEDAYQNIITKHSSTVTLTLADGTFEGGSNTMTATASGGVATFSSIKIDAAGSNAVSAADGLLAPSGASDSFMIRPAAADRLVIHTQPSSTAIAGQPFAIQPEVYEVDQFGNLETGDDSTIVSVSPIGGTGPLEGTKTAIVSGGAATFLNLGDNTAETISLTMKSGSLAQAISNQIVVAPASPAQLVITTPPPSSLVAGQPFAMAVSAEDSYGNVVTSYTGSVTVSAPSDPALTTTVQAKDGVASFVGLTLSAAANGGLIRAESGNLTAAVTGQLSVAAAALPPTIIREQVVMLQKKNKKGKAVGKPVMSGFALVYSTAMNPASAGLAANYQVDFSVKKRVKKKTVTVLKSVPFTSAYNSNLTPVTLTLRGRQKFLKGGQVIVTAAAPGGVMSASGLLLNSNDTTFAILPKARGIRHRVRGGRLSGPDRAFHVSGISGRQGIRTHISRRKTALAVRPGKPYPATFHLPVIPEGVEPPFPLCKRGVVAIGPRDEFLVI